MADQDSFPVGKAPWEQGGSSDPHPDSFPVGKAPWEASGDSGGSLAGAISSVGKAVDSVTGAPVRAAIGAIQDGTNPLSAYGHQFAADPDSAPTGTDIAKRLGLSPERKLVMTADQQRAFDETHNPNRVALTKYQDQYSASPAETAGTFINLAADPLNVLPVLGETEIGAKLLRPLGKGAEAVGKALKGAGEEAAVNATGATGAQAAKFADNSGREILDRGVVKFGDSQANIAKRAGDALNSAEQDISGSLKKLQDQGVTVNANDVYNTVSQKIKQLASDPSKADVAKRLDSELQNLISATDAKGSTEFGINEAENIKRGYNRQAGDWMNPDRGQAGKDMYLAFRDAVEDAATKANPELAQKFKDAKEAYGTLAPIQEAAERRAAQVAQHPAGGFLDLAATAAGDAMGGPGMAIAAPIARRIFAPRIASSMAVAFDKAGNIAKAVPKVAQAASPALPAAEAGAVTSLPSAGVLPAAAAQAPTKGPDKWVNNGLQNLLNHVSASGKSGLQLSPEQLKDPAIKDLLIKASDLKPGSKAMQSLMDQVKAKIAGNSEGED